MIDGRKVVISGVITMFLVEVALMEKKYQVLSGDGFLQAYPMSELSEYFIFFAITLSSFILVYKFTSWIISSILRKFSISHAVADFTAGVTFILVYGVSIITLLKLHQYLADHVDHTVISEIAGGSLATAISYVSNEIVILLLPIAILIITYYLCIRRLKPYPEQHQPRPFLSRSQAILVALSAILFVLLGTDAVAKNASRQLAYGWVKQAIHVATDFDLDGSSLVSQPKDPAPFDNTIYWGAIDIPGNGIDENALGGDLPVGDIDQTITEHFELPGRYRHLVIVVAESLRSDVIGRRINNKLVAPNLNKIASEGSTITNAFSHAGFTSKSLYTLFSGRFTHNKEQESVFQVARKNGFQVSVLSGQDETWGDLDQNLGTRASANFFYDPQEDPEKRVFPSKLPSSIKLSEASLLERFQSHAKDIDWDIPQFMYFNFQAAHFPYFHDGMTRNFVDRGIPRSDINKDNAAWLANTYWNAINYMDQYLGKLVSILKHEGIWDETLLILVGDHGESLFDDGFLGHGHNINRNQNQIPVVLSAPGINFQAPIGLRDVSRWLFGFVQQKPAIIDKRGTCTFMYIGKLNTPAQIGRICKDRLSIEKYTVAFDIFDGANKSTHSTKDILIHYWENILLTQQ